MKNSLYWNGLRLWIQGLLFLALRWAQLKTGFDPDTGLVRVSAPGIVLVALLCFFAVLEGGFALRLPRGKRSYDCCMEPLGQRAVPLLAAGCFLMGAGGVLLPGWGALKIATAAAGLASVLGFLLFARQVRAGGDARTLPLLPSMVFAVLFLLAVYLPEEGNPVLARYYLPVLAASLTACFFYQLAGLPCREGKLGWFVFFGDLAVPFTLASMADGAGNLGRVLACAGSALVMTVFLQLRRAEPLPEPEPAPEEPAGGAKA